MLKNPIFWIIVAVVIIGASVGIVLWQKGKKKKEQAASAALLAQQQAAQNQGKTQSAPEETDPYMKDIKNLMKYGFTEQNAADFIGTVQWYIEANKAAGKDINYNISGAIYDWETNGKQNKLPAWTTITKNQFLTAVKNGVFKFEY